MGSGEMREGMVGKKGGYGNGLGVCGGIEGKNEDTASMRFIPIFFILGLNQFQHGPLRP